jgi:hypothetical protein
MDDYTIEAKRIKKSQKIPIVSISYFRTAMEETTATMPYFELCS